MQRIEWTQQLELGDAEIDAQHRRIVEILNLLHDAVAANLAGADENRLLDELVRLVEKHFRTEEALMRASRDPRFDSHIEAHQILLHSVVELRDSLFRNRDHVNLRTLNFLKRWLFDHMSHTDTELKVIFDRSDRGGSGTPA